MKVKQNKYKEFVQNKSRFTWIVLSSIYLKFNKIYPEFYQRNWVFATNFDFIILITWQQNVADLLYLKLWIMLFKIISLKYKRFSPIVSKDIIIRKFVFVAKTQFLKKSENDSSLFLKNRCGLVILLQI